VNPNIGSISNHDMSGCLLFVLLLPVFDRPFLVTETDEYLKDLLGVLFSLVFFFNPTFAFYDVYTCIQ